MYSWCCSHSVLYTLYLTIIIVYVRAYELATRFHYDIHGCSVGTSEICSPASPRTHNAAAAATTTIFDTFSRDFSPQANTVIRGGSDDDDAYAQFVNHFFSFVVGSHDEAEERESCRQKGFCKERRMFYIRFDIMRYARAVVRCRFG